MPIDPHQHPDQGRTPSPEAKASSPASGVPTRARGAEGMLVAAFLTIIASVMVIQALSELRGGERPRIPGVFLQTPTSANLRAYEHSLEDASVVGRALRPWFQFAQFIFLGDGGEKALAGREGWLFYRPGYDDLLAKGHASTKPQNEPIQAIVVFRDALAKHGIKLLVVPAPNKESIYPDLLSRRTENLKSITAPTTRKLVDDLHAAGIEVVNLFELFGASRAAERGPGAGTEPLYLTQDSHWSPRGVSLAAKAIAAHLFQLGWVKDGSQEYREEASRTERFGDVARMLQSEPIQRQLKPETVACSRVVSRDTGRAYLDDPNSEILILGDSFLRIYQQEEPGAAGLIAHLAKELQQPLTSLVSDGGASTLVRQELYRRPALLRNKKVVIWEFVERDIRLGTEGWQLVPLPAAAPLSAANHPTPP